MELLTERKLLELLGESTLRHSTLTVRTADSNPISFIDPMIRYRSDHQTPMTKLKHAFPGFPHRQTAGFH